MVLGAKKQMSQEVFKITASVGPGSGMDPFVNTSIALSKRAAFALACSEMVGWVDGMWHNYPEGDVANLRAAIEDGYFDRAIEIWNDMASLQIEIEHTTISANETLPDFAWESEESLASSSSSSEESDY